MERLIEFALNNLLLTAAFIIVVTAIIVNEVMTFRRSRFAIDTTDATRLFNRDQAVFVDIRNENAYQKSHLPGAINIPLEHIDKRKDKLKRYSGQTIIAYCDTGSSTLNAVKALQAQGWEQVHQLRGGLTAWRDAGLPIDGRK